MSTRGCTIASIGSITRPTLLPIEYIYVHPLEWMVGAIGPFLGLITVLLLWGSVPAWTLWGYLLVRNLHELDIPPESSRHSGSSCPSTRLLSTMTAPLKANKGQLCIHLRLWDRVLGTYAPSVEPRQADQGQRRERPASRELAADTDGDSRVHSGHRPPAFFEQTSPVHGRPEDVA